MSMGITETKSLLTSVSTLDSVRNLNAVRTQMSGQTRILSAEIKTDKGRGVNTKIKEEELSETKDRLQTINENMNSSITNLNERIVVDREKIREEEAELARQVEKEGASETAPSDSALGETAKIETVVSGANKIIDTNVLSQANISPSTEQMLNAPVAATAPAPTTGTIVDVKL